MPQNALDEKDTHPSVNSPDDSFIKILLTIHKYIGQWTNSYYFG